MTQILNQSFRDWSITRKFPFTDSSDMTCRDGRRIPLSTFIDITLCPDIEGSARISAITQEAIVFSIGSAWTATADMNDFHGGWIPVIRSGICVGCVMLNPNDFEYLLGMTSVEPLEFREGHLELRPETVKGMCSDEQVILPSPTFDGLPSEGMSFEMSGRFSEGESGTNVNTTPILEDETTAITKMTVGQLHTGQQEGDNVFDIPSNGSVLLRTPEWCDTQFISEDGVITFHQRGS